MSASERGEASGRPGLPLEAQDGGMGQCGQFWSGVLHLRSAWLLPCDEEEKWGPLCNQPHLLLEGRAAAPLLAGMLTI